MTETADESVLMGPIEYGAEVDEGIHVNAEYDEAEGETDSAKFMRSPEQPSDAIVDQHRCDHQPYRSWCKFCVMGRGRGIPHGQGQVSSIPVVGIDYFFITRRGVKRRPRGIDLDPKGPDTDLNDDEVIDASPEGD